ncbi:hypothetical protein STHU_43200 [Allostella humosa]|nr:hypothetical protein STHU_43200 [Stella humosa]
MGQQGGQQFRPVGEMPVEAAPGHAKVGRQPVDLDPGDPPATKAWRAASTQSPRASGPARSAPSRVPALRTILVPFATRLA